MILIETKLRNCNLLHNNKIWLIFSLLMLTLTAKCMGKKNCLVKYLFAVKTLCYTSIICLDKTETLI